MSIVTFILLLVVGGVVIWGVIQAFAGKWKELLIAAVVLLVALYILSALGLTLPSLPVAR